MEQYAVFLTLKFYAINISSGSKNGLVLKTNESLCLLLKSAGIKSGTRRPIFLKLIFEVLAHTYRLASILILFPLNFTTKQHNLSETFAINASY